MPPVKIDDVNKNKAGPQTCCDNTACTCESCGDNVACTCHNDAITSSAALFIDSFDDKRTTPSSSSRIKQVVKKSGIKKEKEEGSVTIGIFVGGMTCSNCSNSVSNAIKSSSQGIQDVKINLSTEYALVTFKPHFMNKRGMEEINSIVESIEDAGYEATLDMSTIPAYMRGPATIEEESVTIGISVGGMTCSNCSNSVSNAIKSSSQGIQDVKINLSTEYALVTFKPHFMNKRGMEAVNSIIESIEDAGYEATLDMSTVPPAILNPTSEGMDIEMNGGETVMSSAENRAKVLKERQERDTRKKLNAFLLSCIGSVPILIITMILGRIPGLSGHGGALQAQIVPGFTVEALVLWLLATPVQFGSGWTFYKNSYHNIKNKLLGMDVLVALAFHMGQYAYCHITGSNPFARSLTSCFMYAWSLSLMFILNIIVLMFI